MLEFGQVFTLVGAGLSMLLSSIVILSYVLIEQWRNDMKRIKILLLIICVTVFFEALAAFDVRSNKSMTECTIQAVVIESALVAAFLFEAILSVEMAYLSARLRRGEASCDVMDTRRHFVYYTFVCGVVVVCSTLGLVLNGTTQDPSAFHCHYTAGPIENWLVVFPALASVFTILVANMFSLHYIMTMLKQFSPSLSEQLGGDVELTMPESERWLSLKGCYCLCGCCLREEIETFTRLTTFTQRTIRRILLTQLNFVVVFGVSFVIFGLGEVSVGTFVTLSLILVCAPLNSLLWVYTDTAAIKAWQCLMSGHSLPDGKTDRFSFPSQHGGSSIGGAGGSFMPPDDSTRTSSVELAHARV